MWRGQDLWLDASDLFPPRPDDIKDSHDSVMEITWAQEDILKSQFTVPSTNSGYHVEEEAIYDGDSEMKPSSLPAVQTFHQLKTLMHEIENMAKKTQDSSSNHLSDKNGAKLLFQN